MGNTCVDGVGQALGQGRWGEGRNPGHGLVGGGGRRRARLSSDEAL